LQNFPPTFVVSASAKLFEIATEPLARILIVDPRREPHVIDGERGRRGHVLADLHERDARHLARRQAARHADIAANVADAGDEHGAIAARLA
jgi:hypothetical protein